MREFAEKIVPNHNIITVKKEKLTLDGIKQFWIDCQSQERKYDLLSDIFGLLNVGKSVIFVQSRETAKKLTAFMREKGHSVGILHGADMVKETRDKVLDEFRLGMYDCRRHKYIFTFFVKINHKYVCRSVHYWV